MNKSAPNSSLKDLNLNEDWTSHPAIEWLSAYKNVLLWGFLILIALLIIASRLMTWQTLNAEKDFFQAQNMFTQFEQTAINPAESASATTDLEELKSLMQRHPELKPKYEGALAQTLLISGQPSQAQPFIEDIFTRTQPDRLQLYQNYTETSLLIEQERYAEALQSAQQLKATLEQTNQGSNPILYAFNLIRLAMLYQQTHQQQEELKAWEELQNQPQLLEAVLATDQALKMGQASLNQYIEERKQALR
jgi:hypothetical protein